MQMLQKKAYSLVVPHAGTWIEIVWNGNQYWKCFVVPHAGTWIEIMTKWKRNSEKLVVPHAGTWIEIDSQLYKQAGNGGRSPRGNVD